ncbi:MAG: Flp family type IVb pilin [Acidimicrobiales bacterium]
MIISFPYIATWLKARFSHRDRGASLVEYALLLALIAVFCIVGLMYVGREANETFDKVGDSIAETNDTTTSSAPPGN